MGGSGGKPLGLKNNIEVRYFIDCFLHRKAWIHFKNTTHRSETVLIPTEFASKQKYYFEKEEY